MSRENPLTVYPFHKKILEKLFAGFDSKVSYKILDVGTGRTSLYFLTEKFQKSDIDALLYPGDDRKILPIKRDVVRKNYNLIEIDLMDFKQNKIYDIVLAHLFLGEAEKFNKNKFGSILKRLFEIETDYLILIDILEDPLLDWKLISKTAEQKYTIIKKAAVDKYQGFVYKNSKSSAKG